MAPDTRRRPTRPPPTGMPGGAAEQTARMPRAASNGIEIEYDTFGEPTDPALLLVMGFTAQMTAWDESLLQAPRRPRPVRHPVRQPRLRPVDPPRRRARRPRRGHGRGRWPARTMPPVPYKLTDMAADAIGLLDHLGIERGPHRRRVDGRDDRADDGHRAPRAGSLSMTSIMSMTGEAEYGQPAPEAMAALLQPPPTERSAYIEQSKTVVKVFASKKLLRRRQDGGPRRGQPSTGPSTPRGRRASSPASSPRAAGPTRCGQLDVPTLVIHGRDDTLIQPSGGERTAELIPGSKLLMLHDMGHDLPEPLWPFVAGRHRRPRRHRLSHLERTDAASATLDPVRRARSGAGRAVATLGGTPPSTRGGSTWPDR